MHANHQEYGKGMGTSMEAKMGELGRLRKMYMELGDDHLLDLSEDRGDLTQEARLALDQELLKRKLAPLPESSGDLTETASAMHERSDGFGVGVPGVFPGAAPAVEAALEPNGEQRAGMVRLISFYDGLQLSQACSALEDSGVQPAIEESVGDATIGTPTSFQIWVEPADVATAKIALRKAMGLFPLAEGDEIDDNDAAGEVSDGIVGNFEQEAEAEAVRDLLVNAGFAATLDRESELDTEGARWTNVRVPAVEGVRAVGYLERRMELES